MKKSEVELAIAYLSCKSQTITMEKCVFYSIKPQKTPLKIWYYYHGYKKINRNLYVKDIQDIILDFKPEIIHLFGMESPLATILGNTEIPVIVHLQGLLTACSNAYFPIGINKSNLLYPITQREYLLRNGFCFAKNNMEIRSHVEKEMFKSVHYIMGRTDFDYQITQLLAPQAIYFHVDEILRDIFYKSLPWKKRKRNNVVIVSTISETFYKGFDLILKTALLLKDNMNFDFKWEVIGLSENSQMRKIIERSLKIKSVDVNVHCLGILTAEDLCVRLKNADVYIHPSYIDNSPNSLCEAQMLGLPVIATNVGGIASLVKDGWNGELVPANAPYELAFKIKRQVDQIDYAEKIGKQGRIDAFKRHDKEYIVSKLLSVYNSIL